MRVHSWNQPFDDAGVAQLGRVLPRFLTGRRWFRAKARTIASLNIRDQIQIPNMNAVLLVIEIEYHDGARDEYFFPVSLRPSANFVQSSEVVARLEAPDGSIGTLTEATVEPGFREALLEAVVCNRTWEGQNGSLTGRRESALDRFSSPSAGQIDSSLSRSEQSNTSIVYENKYILKIFRKLEEGINPEIEIGAFLTQRGFQHIPAVLGTIDYHVRESKACFAAAVLEEFVPNRGDAWRYTLESLAAFFERASAAGAPPALPAQHPLNLMAQDLPVEVRGLLGEYATSVHTLGKRTAQMHAALTDETGGPDFAPEPFTRADGEKLFQDLIAQADIALELLRRKLPTLLDCDEDARHLLRLESELTNRFEPLRQLTVSTARIRHHGDYHLGQVLYTGADFIIIDFEGEPVRTIEERRRKALAMRDVAGMVRSFQYAAFAALFGQTSGEPPQGEQTPTLEAWAALWTPWVSALYLNAYFEESRGLKFVPETDRERRVLLDAFLLQKALYELAYELNNRPDWVRIPLRGILSLIAG
ncbi:MAG: putative maltokinase [Acidobacteriaceae bacterium]|nr:putative maltokinase [Acidobacteriaceae bacterium]